MNIENPDHQSQTDPAGIAPFSERQLTDHLIRRAAEAYSVGDTETFNNATAIYDEIRRCALLDTFIDDATVEDDITETEATESTLAAVSATALDFIKPLDGTQAEISVEEQTIVTAQFKELVTDIFLNHADEVTHVTYDGIELTPQDSILLQAGDDATLAYSISVKRATKEREPMPGFEQAERITESIDIQKIVEGLGRDYFGYRLGGDGVLRRWNGGDMYAKIQREREMGLRPKRLSLNSRREEMPDPIELMTSIAEGAQNARLERKFGLNNQPVGIEEFGQLRDLLMNLEAYVPLGFGRKRG